ncbi:MAG TPA: DNA-formamidopyrimidine glycosylase [Chloroflexota bacterium]|nr:DNA-formamidopyrimidine glycosylase [Chloroflexota bacterium]
MPELPEVEGARRKLLALVVGHTIRRLEVHDPKLWHPAEGLDVGAAARRTVRAIQRHAKILDFTLDGDLRLLLHLKIAGQIAYVHRDGTRWIGGHPYPLPTAELPDASTRFSLHLDTGDVLHVNDQRRFAWLRLFPVAEAAAFVAEHKFGPDPLAESFTPQLLGERLRARKGRPIKAALLDQTCVSGLGNIYADESLHAARLHPMTRAGDVTSRQVAALHDAIRSVLELAVPVGGAYVVNGRAATPQDQQERDFLRAHGRAGERCPDCTSPKGVIVREFLAGRGTYYCPACQRPTKRPMKEREK